MIGKYIRVVVVDDHHVIRVGLRTMLEEGGDEFCMIGEASDGADAVRIVGELQPDVVLMDLRMPGMDGLQAIEDIHRQWPAIAVIILTTYNEDSLMIRGLQSGASGYLLKDTDLNLLLDAIRKVARGERVIQPDVMERLLSHAARATVMSSSVPVREKSEINLTKRELEVLAGAARGERSKEIAARLGITERTVGAYMTGIFTKLNVDSRASAVAAALERGLLPRREL